MGFYAPNIVQIPLESFTYKSQSEVLGGPDLVRQSKWKLGDTQEDNQDGETLKTNNNTGDTLGAHKNTGDTLSNHKNTVSTQKGGDTLFEAFRAGAGKSVGGLCLGWRSSQILPFQWLTYDEVLLRAQNFGSGLISMGLTPGVHTRVGIYSRNCPEWVIAEQAMYCHSMVNVPLYDSLGPDARSFVIAECDMRLVVAFDETCVKNVLDSVPACLKVIVTIRDIQPNIVEEADSLGLKVVRFAEVEKFGAAHRVPEDPPLPSTTATICFSRLAAFGDQAVDDRPKGVMLSHGNLVAATSACVLQLGKYSPGPQDILLSFLPLAHTLERCCELAVLMAGGAIGFYSGNMKSLAADMKVLKPTILPVVPRFLNRIYDDCVNTANKSSIFRHIFNFALSSKTEELYKGIVRNNSLWDKLVFWSVRKRVGGRVRLMVVGSAPLAANVVTFMRAAMGCIIVEGYGQTECGAPITMTAPGDPQPDHVGPPVACNQVKLVDVPDMEYFATSGQGEVCVKGDNVFQGYFRDPERTMLVLDPAGWLHTGDVGEWLANGTLRIIDRKKTVFKLSQGEYVAPDRIEGILTGGSKFIAQVFVHGDSLKSCVIAVVVPEVRAVQDWAVKRGLANTDSFTALCNSREVKKFISEEVHRLSRVEGLAYYEEVKDIYLHPNLFSVQNGLMSSSGKLMRQKLVKYFKPQLEDMYRVLD